MMAPVSLQLSAASPVRYWRATGWLRVVLAMASTKPRTISSRLAPATGGSASMPTSSGGSATWVISTGDELVGTVPHPARTTASATNAGRALTAGSAGGGGRRRGAAAAGTR
ncbi:unannotated protein [freshwater metagenome]|uniref:Unannotated protein n=1 Tax=freshwater metagenome TaxID=449393 RepID=A0A6J7I9H8_9ZZZZ